VSWIFQPFAVGRSTGRRLSPPCVERLTRPAEPSRASARLTATLSIAVRSATSRADMPSPLKRASTAMTRHSVIERLKRSVYSRAIAWLTRFDRIERRYGRKRSSSRGA
jgi:transposase